MKKLLISANCYHDRIILFSFISLILNVVIGIAYLIFGIFLLSIWFFICSLYYLTLCAARLYVLKRYFLIILHKKECDHRPLELRLYKHTGYFLCAIAIINFIECTIIKSYGKAYLYEGYMCYVYSITYSIKLGISAYGIIVAKRRKSLLAMALKKVSIADAIISIVVTTYSLLVLTSFEFAIKRTAILGICSSIIILFLGIIMILGKEQDAYHNAESILILEIYKLCNGTTDGRLNLKTIIQNTATSFRKWKE